MIPVPHFFDIFFEEQQLRCYFFFAREEAPRWDGLTGVGDPGCPAQLEVGDIYLMPDLTPWTGLGDNEQEARIEELLWEALTEYFDGQATAMQDLEDLE